MKLAPVTEEYLTALWSVKDMTVSERFEIHSKLVSQMDLLRTAVIGRDLLVRRKALFVPRFYLAAFLATESETGHDGFLDFTDCVAVLPSSRFNKITENPDCLIDDEIPRDYTKIGFIKLLLDRFDKLTGAEEDLFVLDYLVFGFRADNPWSAMHDEATAANAKKWLPRLYARYGDYLLK